MAKLRRNSIFIVLLVVCMALTLTLVACNKDNDPPASKTYTVKVLVGENTPAVGAKVTIKQNVNTVGNTTVVDATTGVATFTLVEGDYTAEITDLPAHYDIPAGANLSLTKDARDITITLERKFAYTVTLVNEDGTPFEVPAGVTVGVCKGTTCYEGVVPEGNVAIIERAKDDYHVKIYDLPKEYTYDADQDGYYLTETFSETKTSMTIKIYHCTVLDITGTPMTPEEKTAFIAKVSDYNNYSDLKSYKFELTLPAGVASDAWVGAVDSNIQRFVMTADFSGEYKFFHYHEGEPSDVILGAYDSVLAEGQNYYFTVSNGTLTAKTATFVIACPDTTQIQVEGVEFKGDNEIPVTIGTADKYAIIEFSPSQGGKYTISTPQATSAIVVKSGEQELTDAMENLQSTDFSSAKSVDYKFTEDQIGNKIYIGVAIKVANYPTTASVSIVQAKQLKNNTTDAPVSESLKQQEKPEGQVLLPVEITQENATGLSKGEDGFYHLGSPTGELVWVLITEPITDKDRWYAKTALAYLEQKENVATYVLDVTSTSDKENNDKGNTYLDYRLRIRGFKDYDVKESANSREPSITIPTTLTEQNCYANFVNEDGAYPLNEELLNFLTYLYNSNKEFIEYNAPQDVEKSLTWMFPLFYYGESVEADAIVGDYNYTRAYIYSEEITDPGAYRLEVTATRFTIYEVGRMGENEYCSGTWTKQSEGNYTFTGSDQSTVYTVTFNESAGTIRADGNNGTNFNFVKPTQA